MLREDTRPAAVRPDAQPEQIFPNRKPGRRTAGRSATVWDCGVAGMSPEAPEDARRTQVLEM